MWNVASNKQTIWAKWIHETKLKGCSVWEAKSDKCASHGWKQILNLRNKIHKHVTCQVGNGESIFLWHDKWWGPESLSEVIPMEYIEQAGLSHNMKVKDMISNGQWCWPDNWYSEFPILSTIHVPTLCATSEDKYMWYSNNGKSDKYSTKKVWEDLRQGGSQVDWYDIVWFSNCTPKHSFIMWMAIQGRLSTQERLHQWYPEKIMACPLCEKCLDSLNHLFFECHYSGKLWRTLKEKAGYSYLPDKWDDIISSLTIIRHNKAIRSVLIRIILAACVYFVWNERNKRSFTSEGIDNRELIENVINHVRLKLSSLKVKKSAQIVEVSKQWDVLMNEV